MVTDYRGVKKLIYHPFQLLYIWISWQLRERIELGPVQEQLKAEETLEGPEVFMDTKPRSSRNKLIKMSHLVHQSTTR